MLIATLSLFRAPDPTRVGVVEVKAGLVVGFEEKPAHPRGDFANAGMYAFAPAVIDEITGPDPRDIGFHLLPATDRPGSGGSAEWQLLHRYRDARGAAPRPQRMGRQDSSVIVTQTPLRVGLVGGGTDLPGYYREHGGRVLNAAIDKYIYVIVKQRFDDDIYVNYSQKEIVSRVEDIQHELVREAMYMTGVRSGVEITTLADIPSAGSGLGSSSAVTVGLLHALFAYQGRQVTAQELAERACTIEIDRCRKPIGKQDQYAAAYGGICDLRFGPGDRVDVEQITLLAPDAAADVERAPAVLHRHHPQRERDPRRAVRKHCRPAATARPAA